MASASKKWRFAAAVFTVINFAGMIYAGVMGEPMHAAVHAALTVLGGMFFGILYMREVPPSSALPQETVDRLKHLEQSVDALAISVERVGEAQRYQTKILDEKKKVGQAPPSPPPSQSKKEEG